MALTLNKLSALAVARKSKPGYYGDGGGLWLQVAKSGSKSWIFRFAQAGRQREMGLGGLRTVDLAKARALAKECRTMLLEGSDPIEARKVARTANALERARSMSFDQCAAAYVAAHRGGWKNAKHADQWKNTLATYASPIIGALRFNTAQVGRACPRHRGAGSGRADALDHMNGLAHMLLGLSRSSARSSETPDFTRIDALRLAQSANRKAHDATYEVCL